MRRFLIFFSLALLLAAGVPAAAQMGRQADPPIWEGPSWFPALPDLVFDIQIEHPGNSTGNDAPEGLGPMSNEPGPGAPGRKASTHGQSVGSVNASSGLAMGSVLDGSSFGGSFDPVAELEVRVRDARRALDS